MALKVSFSLSYPAELGSSPNAVWYDMIVYFDSINLILEYSSHPINSLSKEGNTVDVCPITDQFEGVNIWLGKEPINPPVLGFPLENVSPFSVKEFYDVIVINNGCFSLDASKFSR